MMKKLIALAIITAVTACGGAKKDDEIISGTVTGEDGEKAEFSVTGDGDEGGFSIKTKDGSFNLSANTDDEAKLPFGLKLLPGSSVKSNVQMNSDGEGANGGMITFESDLSPDKIVAYYKEQATSAGFKVGTELTSDGTMMFNATRNETDTINVSAMPGDSGKTTGNIIAGSKN